MKVYAWLIDWFNRKRFCFNLEFNQCSEASLTFSAIKWQQSCDRFEWKKPEVEIALFEYQEQLIFEAYWLCKTHPHYDTAPITPKTPISKWHLRFDHPLLNVVPCSILKWSLSKFLLFSKMVVQIKGTSVHVRSWFLRARNALSTNGSVSPLYVMSSALYGFKSLLQDNLQVDSWRFAINTSSNHDHEIRIFYCPYWFIKRWGTKMVHQKLFRQVENRICRNKRPSRHKHLPKTVIFQRGEYTKPMSFDGWFFQRGEYTKTDGFWWVSFQRGEYTKPKSFDGWVFQRGEYTKTDGFWWVIFQRWEYTKPMSFGMFVYCF